MFRILQVEFKKYIKSPAIIGYILIPTIFYLITSFFLDSTIALSFTIFIQILFVALFIYAIKVKEYNNETMKKKIQNSHISMFQIVIVSYFLANIILLISLILPLILASISVESLSSFEKNQYDTYFYYQDQSIEFYDMLSSGLNQNLLLFNANWKQFGEFVYAFLFIDLAIFSLAHLLMVSLKTSAMYFSVSLSLFVIIILFSSLFEKEMFTLAQGQYTRSIPIVQNDFFVFLKYVNPFYWMNQMLMATIIADSNSGLYIEGSVPSEFVNIIPGTFYASYYDIFSIGTQPFVDSEGILINDLYRSVYLENLEVFQIMMISVGPMLFVTCFSATIIRRYV